jgi:hypothetical protein
MKHLAYGLMFAAVALAEHPKVSDCFKVHEMIRADEEHYWTTWTNACPYTIDSVYVTVKFADHSSRDLADGVWALHFIAPGAHRTMRFSAPGRISDFASVRKQKITSDMAEAFGRESAKPALNQVEMAAVSAFKGAVAREGRTIPKPATVSTIVTDSGEAAYRFPPPDVNEILAKIQIAAIPAVVLAQPPISIPSDGEENMFLSDFPDPWRAVLTPQEWAVSPAPRASFVRFVSEEKLPFQ